MRKNYFISSNNSCKYTFCHKRTIFIIPHSFESFPFHSEFSLELLRNENINMAPRQQNIASLWEHFFHILFYAESFVRKKNIIICFFSKHSYTIIPTESTFINIPKPLFCKNMQISAREDSLASFSHSATCHMLSRNIM